MLQVLLLESFTIPIAKCQSKNFNGSHLPLAARSRAMPAQFIVGQMWECTEDGRQAIVAGVRSDGREGLLRLVSSNSEEWHLWHEWQQAGKWHLKGAERRGSS
jgi:hypothetical protein